MKRAAFGALVLMVVAVSEAGVGATASAGSPAGSVSVTFLREPSGASSTVPRELNDDGQAVATSVVGGAERVVLWDDGDLRDLRARVPLTAEAISESGQVAATGRPPGTGTSSAFWWAGRRWRELPATGTLARALDVNERNQVVGVNPPYPGGGGIAVWTNGQFSEPVEYFNDYLPYPELNNAGQAVGSKILGTDSAALWHPTLGDTILGYYDDGSGTAWPTNGVAVNERTHVVGTTRAGESLRALVHRGEGWIDVGTLGGQQTFPGDVTIADNSPRLAFNESDQLVGSSETASGTTRAFLWRNGRIRDLGTLGGATSTAVAVNDHGQVVGMSDTAQGHRHAFLWDNGTMIDLSRRAGTHTAVAFDINNHGQILGAVRRADGTYHRPLLWTATALAG